VREVRQYEIRSSCMVLSNEQECDSMCSFSLYILPSIHTFTRKSESVDHYEGAFVRERRRNIKMRFTSEPASTMLPMKTPFFLDLMSMVTYDTVRLGVKTRDFPRQRISVAYPVTD
jgi:hypothetical protein